MEEIWKDIPRYEGYYQASNTGRYRSIDREVLRSDGKRMHIRGKELKLTKGLDDYAVMLLTRNSKTHPILAHRVIAQLFLPDFDATLTVNHKDGNKFNNSVDNLEMMTLIENLHHFHTSPVFDATRKHIAENTSRIHKGKKRSRESIDKWKVSYAEYVSEHGGVRKGAVLDSSVRKKISFGEGTHVRCIETDQYFTSYKAAARHFNVDITTMIEWCRKGLDKRSKLHPDLHFEVTVEPDISKYID